MFLILIIILAFSKNANANLIIKNLNCSGQSKIIGIGGDVDSFYEDFKVFIDYGKIIGIETIDTNHGLLRSTFYGYDNLISSADKITINQDRHQDGEMILETFKGTISLSSGRYRGYWKGSNGSYNYTITWDSVCKGSDELYAFLNNIDEGTKNIDNNKLYAASSGTGFFVSSLGHMITNHHVIDKCNPIKTIYNGKEFDTTTLAIDQNNDLAIIKADIKPTKHFAVSNNDAQLLEDVIVAGYPLGKNVSSAIKATSGTVTALAGVGDNYSEFQTDAALNSGNSGGPIIDENGNVIGVAVSKLQGENIESFNFGVKSSVLKTFARSNNLNFSRPNTRAMKKKDLGELITTSTVYIECWMMGKDLKKLISNNNSRKAFYSSFK